MKTTNALMLAVSILLTACSDGSSGTANAVADAPQVDPQNPNLPTGQPVETLSDPIPEPEPPTPTPPNTLNSTTPEWQRLINEPVRTENACQPLMDGMRKNRGLLYYRPGNLNPQTWWYFSEGYVVTYSWDGSETCWAEDYTFVDTSFGRPSSEPEITAISNTPSEIAPPVFDPLPPTQVSPPETVEFSFVEYTESFGRPAALMRVRNNQVGLRIYNVFCDVQALNGSNIVDTGFAYFANGSTINGGESAEDVARFSTLNSFDDFETIRWECDHLIR